MLNILNDLSSNNLKTYLDYRHPNWIPLVYVMELVFIIKNVNDSETSGRKDIEYTQYHNTT